LVRSTGLARRESRNKQHLAACALKRHNDLHGRSTLNEETLAEFTAFFLRACIDQASFMEEVMKPEKLRDRILIWTEEQISPDASPPTSDIALKIILYQGELQRGEIAPL